MRPSQNILLPPRIYSPFQQLYASLPESTTPSQNIGSTLLFNNSMRPSQNLPPPSKNIPPFSTTICDPPRVYPSLPECTPFSMSTIYDPPTIYPSLPEYTPFAITICDPPRIYSSLPEYTPTFNNYKIMRPAQNLPLPPRIFFSSGSKW